MIIGVIAIPEDPWNILCWGVKVYLFKNYSFYKTLDLKHELMSLLGVDARGSITT